MAKLHIHLYIRKELRAYFCSFLGLGVKDCCFVAVMEGGVRVKRGARGFLVRHFY